MEAESIGNSFEEEKNVVVIVGRWESREAFFFFL